GLLYSTDGQAAAGGLEWAGVGGAMVAKGSASLLFPWSWLGKHFQKAHYGRHRIGGFGRPFVDGQGGIGIGANVPRALAFGKFGCSEFGEVSAEACLILFRQSLWNPG